MLTKARSVAEVIGGIFLMVLGLISAGYNQTWDTFLIGGALFVLGLYLMFLGYKRR